MNNERPHNGITVCGLFFWLFMSAYCRDRRPGIRLRRSRIRCPYLSLIPRTPAEQGKNVQKHQQKYDDVDNTVHRIPPLLRYLTDWNLR